MGLLLIDKPKNFTSHDVIAKLRKITGIKKIGHAGTLDPNATGLLICAITREYTKQLENLTKNTKKTYIAEITLGEERDTLDSEGQITSQNSLRPNMEQVKKALEKFKGEISQVPPIYSALKIDGKKAYELARRGKNVEMKSRKITIYKNKLISYKYPVLELELEVSAGTYIRSIARDIGKELGAGAYLSNLRRTKIGEYNVTAAIELEDLTSDNWQNKQIT